MVVCSFGDLCCRCDLLGSETIFLLQLFKSSQVVLDWLLAVWSQLGYFVDQLAVLPRQYRIHDRIAEGR